MKHEPVGVREGLVTISADSRGRLELNGLNVMGYSEKGGLINRKVLISRKAPVWFTQLCFRYADTDFKIRVKVVATYRGKLAYVVPVAGSEKEAVQELVMIRSQGDISGRTMTSVKMKYATKAHEYWAAKNSLTIVEHHVDEKRIRSSAIDASGKTVLITGGYIVSCLKEKIEDGSLNWEAEVNRFIRIRSLTSISV